MKENIKTRREFFKKATRMVLPMLGLVLLSPYISACGSDEPSDGSGGSSKGCSGCASSCTTACGFSCKGNASWKPSHAKQAARTHAFQAARHPVIPPVSMVASKSYF